MNSVGAQKSTAEQGLVDSGFSKSLSDYMMDLNCYGHVMAMAPIVVNALLNVEITTGDWTIILPILWHQIWSIGLIFLFKI